ncbi:MAG: hypothetical protein U0930_10305 [Pirellulales bacterium]
MSDDSPLPQLPNTLSSRNLTIGLISLTLIPFFFVVLLYVTQPTAKDPELNVMLSILPRPWQSNDGTQTRLLPTLIVHNPTQDEWNNVNFAINDQFFYYHDAIVKPNDELSIPLKFFHTKGNQFFPPESQPLNTLTVYAQIPKGTRAIREFSGKELQWTK